MSPRAAALAESAGQPFLHGPTLYFRGIELNDAKFGTAWSPCPFPVPVDLLEERLKEAVPGAASGGTFRLIACRRGDDLPVGSAEYAAADGHSAWVTLYVDPLMGGHGSDIRAEMLSVIMPWLLSEREFLSAWVDVRASDKPVVEAAQQIGLRRVARLREMLFQEGERHDLLCFEGLNERWLDRLGRPAPVTEGAVERPVASPPPARTREGLAPPDNAFAVGQRVYLRPIEQADAEEMARWSARESESFHDQGRHIRSPISHWVMNRKLAEANPPQWVRYAIVDREREIVIGGNGLAEIDWINRTAETETEIVRPEYRGAGYGTEAKHLLLEYAFERLGLHAVYAYAWEFNTRSCDALVKQGYRVAGRLAWTGVKNGQFVDDMVFDLLASEWRASRSDQL